MRQNWIRDFIFTLFYPFFMVGISAIGVSRGISGKDSDLTSLPVIFWPDQFLTLGQVSGWQCHELYEAWWRAGGSDKVIVCLTTTSSFTALLDSYLWKPKKTIVIRYIFYWHTSWYGGSCFIIQHAFVTFVLFCVNFTNPRACLARLKYSLCLLMIICPLF